MEEAEIPILRQGEIVERGTHRELLDMDGVYRELHNRFIRDDSA